MARTKIVGIRLSENEYRVIEEKAKKAGLPVSVYAKNCVTEGQEVSLMQLRIMLSDMRNLMGNVFLGERLIAGRMDEMFRSISTRMAEKDPSKLTQEQRSEVEARTEKQLEVCVANSIGKVAESYGGDGQDSLRLDEFGKSLDSML